MKRGTKVLSLQASDFFDNVVNDTRGYVWYRCVLAIDTGRSGWIYGKYVGCRMNVKDPQRWVTNFNLRYNLGRLFPIS